MIIYYHCAVCFCRTEEWNTLACNNCKRACNGFFCKECSFELEKCHLCGRSITDGNTALDIIKKWITSVLGLDESVEGYNDLIHDLEEKYAGVPKEKMVHDCTIIIF